MKNDPKSVWTNSNVPNLCQQLNRRYYAKVFVDGKEIWKSLKTKLKGVAIEHQQEHATESLSRDAEARWESSCG